MLGEIKSWKVYDSKFFFFNQKTAYELRISDWSSDVCSSDLNFRRAGIEIASPAGCGPKPPRIALGKADCIAQFDRAEGAYEKMGGAGVIDIAQQGSIPRSEERRVGKECVSTCRSRCSPYH